MSRGLFNPDFVRSLVKRHQTGTENHSERLWALVNFEMWLRQFIDGEDSHTSNSPQLELAETT
jgi:asparagine synthase (glutamine-hydrolysing)